MLRVHQSVLDGRVRIRPAALPEGEVCHAGVEEPEPAVLAQRGARVLEVRPRVVEVAAADLELGAQHEQHIGEPGGESADRRRALGLRPVPVADGDQRLDQVGHEHGAAVSVRCLEPELREPRGLPGPSQHRQCVGGVDVRPVEADAVVDLLGEPYCPAEAGEALLGAAEVRQVGSLCGQRPDLRRAGADSPGERERLLGDRQRLGVGPGDHQRAGKCRQAVRALGRGRVCRDELHGAPDRGERSLVAAGSVEIFAEANVQQRRSVRVVSACELDRPPGELDCAPIVTDLVGELGCPRAEVGEADAGELGRVGDGWARARAPARGARGPRPGRTPPRPDRPRRQRRPAPPRCGPPPPSAARAPPPTRRRCGRALRRGARAAPRARPAGSSSRSPRPGARGGSGSCSSPARRRGHARSTARRSDSRTSGSRSAAAALSSG